MGQVDIGLAVQQTTGSDSSLKNLITELKKIQDLAKVQLGIDTKAMDATLTKLQQTHVAQEAINKTVQNGTVLEKQLLDLQKLRSSSMVSGLTKSVSLIDKYIKGILQQTAMTGLEVKELNTVIAIEKDKVKWQERSAQLEQSRLGNLQKEAIAMNKLVDKNTYDEALQEDKLRTAKLAKQKEELIIGDKLKNIEREKNLLTLDGVAKEQQKLVYLQQDLNLEKSKKTAKQDLVKIAQLELDILRQKTNVDKAQINQNTPKVVKDTTMAMAGYMYVVQQILSIARQQITYFKDLEKSVYDMGVVAEATTEQIKVMRTELLRTSTEFPIMAKTMSDSIDAILRTGKPKNIARVKSLFMLEHPKVA